MAATAAPAGGAMEKGAAVQFFYEADASDKKATLVRARGWPSKTGPLMVLSHGWLPGTLAEAYDPAAPASEDSKSWPSVVPNPEIVFSKRDGQKVQLSSLRVRRVRTPCLDGPLLSLSLVRWGGAYSKWMDEQEANEGDWGRFGSPPSDEYMKALIETGVMKHPTIADSQRVEIWHVFVKSTDDVWEMTEASKAIAKQMRAKKRSQFWMLWPAEWEDNADPDFACYAERQAVFAAMRACEGAGIPSGFPHPADQFEYITSKSWMATLSLNPRARLPACVLVSKEQVVLDAASAARDALAGMAHIRMISPFEAAPEDPRSLHKDNLTGIKKGVVKLGWSWENRFVSVFNGPEQLAERLKGMLTQPGCMASSCIVQEFVDFDFEMRQYFLPPSVITPGERFEPRKIECNAWGKRSEEGSVGTSHASFSKVSEAEAIERWSGDTDAWDAAKKQATDTAQFLIANLLAANAKPVPMIRLDFMMKRLGPGRVRCVFGEYCEMGACCLNWKDGPPTIWRSALDSALR